jgi:S-adenosylmethionine decarboxylase
MGYAALDIYTCGAKVKPDKAVVYAVEAFKAETSHITEITRGIDEGDQIYYHSFITWEEHLRRGAAVKDRERDKAQAKD